MSSLSTRTISLGAAVILLAGCWHSHGGSRPAEAKPNTITAQDIQSQPGEDVEKILGNRIAGVRVSRAPDGGLAVQIRGGSSIAGNNEPLYLLDGMPIQPGPGGVLNGISPSEIESISVVKDPANLAMYGSRGANGVIIIKTKRAH